MRVFQAIPSIFAQNLALHCLRMACALTRIESASMRIESAATRIESASMRIESAPIRIDSAPTRIDSAPIRIESASTRTENAAMRIESASIRIESASTRMKPDILQADQDAQVSLTAMTDYKPAIAAFSLANVAGALTAMQATQQAELRAARDAAAAAEWRFHEAMLGAKDQVIAQYGVNSDQVQALGLKKKSERKRPVRQAKSA